MTEKHSSRWMWIVLAIVVVAGMAYGVVQALPAGDDTVSDGPATLPEADDGDGGVSVSEDASPTELLEPDPLSPGRVDSDVSVEDPVPDDLVAALFAMLEAQGSAPLMNETYTVEFRGDTDTVYMRGEFEDGLHEFEFRFADDSWLLEVLS